MTPHSKNSKKAAAATATKKMVLEAVVDKFLVAWAEWHDTAENMPSHEVIEAAGELFDARGKTFAQHTNGQHYVVTLAPKPKRRAAK